MRNILQPLSLFVFALAQGNTINADVTGDGVYDKITIGLQSIMVVDKMGCCKRNRFLIVPDLENLSDVMVDDFLHGIRGKEIAVVMLSDQYHVTEIYGFKKNKFIKVSETLPGIISFDKDEKLFGHDTRIWQGVELKVPCPIIEHEKFLKPAYLQHEIETTIVINPKTTKEIEIDLLQKTLAIVTVACLEKDAIIFLQDKHGSLVTQREINSETPLSGKVYAEVDETVKLIIDNLQSGTKKTIHYIVKHYAYAIK